MSTDYYAVLGLRSMASQDEIKKQYKKLAIKFHPDKTKDKDHHQKFLLIQEAYDTLKEEDLRQKYNREHGVDLALRPESNFALFKGATSGNEYPSYSRQQYLRTSYGSVPFGSSFYDFYQRSRAFHDHFTRTSRYEAAEDNVDRTAMYAEVIRQKMRADQERRQAEYVRQARKQREEEELRQKLEESLKKQKEEKRAFQAETQKSQAAFANSQGFGDAKSEYDYAKLEAHHKAREDQNFSFGSRRENGSQEFIVVDDEEPASDNESYRESKSEFARNAPFGNEANASDVKIDFAPGSDPHLKGNNGYATFEKQHNEDMKINLHEDISEQSFDGLIGEADGDDTGSVADRSAPPSETAGDYTNTSFPSESAQNTAPSSAKHIPEVVEVPEDSDYESTHNESDEMMPNEGRSHASNGSSHTRSHSLTEYPGNSFDERLKETYKGSKKPRLSDYEDMRGSLNTFLDDVDFSDIRSTLPDYPPRTRKASSSSTFQPYKRARFAEYTDGNSNAETVYTPVNKGYSRSTNSTISVADLSPEIDDSALIFTAEIPNLNVSLNTRKSEWDEYVRQILEYQQKFAEYRKSVMEYQMGRLEKDDRHHNVIYSDTSCLDVYQSCLFNDVLLLQNYTRALQEFRQTLRTFHINFETVNKMKGKPR